MLLLEHFFFLGHYFSLVLECECEREGDEESGGGDDPDDVADKLGGFFGERGGFRDFCGDGVTCGRGYDVSEGSETVKEGFVEGVV